MTRIEDIDIKGLLPQQPPFVMIDRLTMMSETQTATSLVIREDNIFIDHGCLNPCGLTENIAQTCSARMGYIDLYINHLGLHTGVIGAVRDLVIVDLPKVGEEIRTEITVVAEAMGVTLVDAVVTAAGRQLATAQMKIAQTGEVKA